MKLNLYPSRIGAVILVALYLPLGFYLGHGFIRGYSLFLLLFPILGLCCVLHLTVALRKYAFLTHPEAVTHVSFEGQQAVLSYRNGKQACLRLKYEQCTFWQSVVILVFAGKRYNRKVILFPDSTDEKGLRHLRVQLRLSA